MREIRTLRATGRGLETGPWQAGLRRRLRKGRLQPPEAYRYRASPRPYVRPAKAGVSSGSQSHRGNSQEPRSLNH